MVTPTSWVDPALVVLASWANPVPKAILKPLVFLAPVAILGQVDLRERYLPTYDRR